MARLELGIVWSREDCEQAAGGRDMVNGEALAHVGEVLPAAARIGALVRPQNQAQPVGLQKLLYRSRLSLGEAEGDRIRVQAAQVGLVATKPFQPAGDTRRQKIGQAKRASRTVPCAWRYVICMTM